MLDLHMWRYVKAVFNGDTNPNLGTLALLIFRLFTKGIDYLIIIEKKRLFINKYYEKDTS